MKMKGLAIGMTLAPRRAITVNTTVKSLREAGFNEMVRVFGEPGSPSPQQDTSTGRGIKLFHNKKKLGAFKNFFNALSSIVESTNAEYILMIQDDVIFNARTRKIWENALGFRRVGCWNFFLARHHRMLAKKNGKSWHSYNERPCLWGALAYMFKREVAEQMLVHDYFLKHYRENPKRIDVAVDRVLEQMNLNKYYHNPSLTRHIGHSSTLGHTITVDHAAYNFKRM